MNITKHLLEGAKVIALFGAVALVIWSMPESGGPYVGPSGAGSGHFIPGAR